MDMRVHLAAKPNEQACGGAVCLDNQAFDAQVQVIGARLASAAYEIYPDLKKKIPKFTFSVAEKKVLGSASNASGAVVLFRGVQHLSLGDEATAFLMAREMGHVIANHHKSNAKTKLLFTVLTGILFPAVSILSASSAAAQATTATTVLTSAASTATSFVGSEVALSRIKPSQLSEADDISIALLKHEGLSKADVAQSLEFIVENENSTGWEKDLNQSTHYVRKLAGEPEEIVVKLESLPEADLDSVTAAVAPIAPIAANTSQPKKLAYVEPVVQAATPIQAAQPKQKPVEPRKIILITNQTLAESRYKMSLASEKSAALASERREQKGLSKKTIKAKNKAQQATKTKSNSSKANNKLAAKKPFNQARKKDNSVKFVSKVNPAKSKVLSKVQVKTAKK